MPAPTPDPILAYLATCPGGQDILEFLPPQALLTAASAAGFRLRTQHQDAIATGHMEVQVAYNSVFVRLRPGPTASLSDTHVMSNGQE